MTYAENGKDAESVNYSRLVAVLIEAMKDQQDQIDTRQAALEQQQRLLENQQMAIETLVRSCFKKVAAIEKH